MSGKKDDHGKLAAELLADLPHALKAVIAVMTFGQAKYGSPSGWKEVENGKERYFGAQIRHMLDRLESAECDIESGLPIRWHEVTNALFQLQIEIEDDLAYFNDCIGEFLQFLPEVISHYAKGNKKCQTEK